MDSITLLPLAVALMICIRALGACIVVELATSKFLEASARQPELMPALQTKFFVGVGVIDSAFIIATRHGAVVYHRQPVRALTCGRHAAWAARWCAGGPAARERRRGCCGVAGRGRQARAAPAHSASRCASRAILDGVSRCNQPTPQPCKPPRRPT
jgi:F-type H+-transporting ATPase subunit c